MKKIRTFLLSILLLISIFSFNNSVYADVKEMTCVYRKPDAGGYKKVLIQYKDGTIEAYQNDKNKKISEDGWTQIPKDKIISKIGDDSLFKKDKDKNEYIDSTGHLLQCPYGIAGGSKELKYYPKSDNAYITQKILSNETLTKAVKPGTKEAKEEEENKEETKGKKCSEIDFTKAWLSAKSTLSCLYGYETNKGCTVIQLNLAKGNKPQVFENISNAYSGPGNSVTVKNNIKSIDDVIKVNNGNCPVAINIENKTHENKEGIGGNINIGLSGSGSNYILRYSSGENLSTGETIEGSGGLNVDFEFEETTVETCSDLFSGTSGEKLKDILIAIRVIVQVSIPVMLIGLGVLDFAKAVLSESEDNMKKIQNKFIKRLIIGIAFFLIPAVLRIILGISHAIWPVISADLCGII